MTITPLIASVLTAVSLFLGMLAFVQLGRMQGRRSLRATPDTSRAGIGVIEGAVFALMGLLIAFSFSSAAARFEGRRALIVQDAVAIGTAYQRLDLLPEPYRTTLRTKFRELVDSRIRISQNAADSDAVARELQYTYDYEKAIWNLAIEGCRTPEAATSRNLILPPINAVFDLGAERYAASRTHIPATIMGFLIFLLMAGSFLAGFGLAASPGKNRVHSIAFAGILASAVYVIIDLEHPRVGLITLDEYDETMVELRKTMD